MRRWCPAIVVTVGLTAALGCLYGDGGVVLESRKVSGLQVTVFGSPVPLRAGPADISVLLQDESGAVLDAGVEIRWTSEGGGVVWLPPCCSMRGDEEAVRAVRGHARNRLLYSAIVPIAASGAGILDVSITRGGDTHFLSLDLEAAPPQPPLLAYWPWLAMMPLAVALFALHQQITAARAVPPPGPQASKGEKV